MALCLSVILYAQNRAYPLDTIDGKVYYKYAVQKSEGLYRISKNFNVSQEEIVKSNPELQSAGLKLGQTILIPYVEQIDSSQYIVHELQPKETLYGLSKKYGVRIAQIQELNPVTSKSMGIGERLLIAKKTDTQTPVAAAESTPATVETSPAAESKTAETAATETTTAAAVQPAGNLQPVDSLGAEENTPQSAADASEVEQLRPLRIAYMLPFLTDMAKRDASVDRFLEFYEGALLAIHEAQDNGQKFEIYAYDTEKGDTRIKQLLADSAALGGVSLDAIIGPAYSSQIAAVTAFAMEKQIPVIIPFSDKVADIETNPYLLRFNSSDEQEGQVLCRYIRQQENAHCLFVNLPAATLSVTAQALLQQLGEAKVNVSEVQGQVLFSDSLSALLDPVQTNILIFSTEQYAAVQPYLQKINALRHQYKLQVLSYYSWTQSDLELEHFYTSVFHPSRLIDLPLFAYNARFKRYFTQEPKTASPRYDLLGYDITSWLIQMLQQAPNLSLQEKIEAIEYQGLQSDIRFRRMAEGGYENMAVEVLQK